MWGWVEWLIVIIFILLIIWGGIKRRGYFLKDKAGNKLHFKEYMKRWGQGIEGITPVQITKTQLMGTWIVITGVIAGIVINALTRMKNQWIWIEIVLIGSLIVSTTQIIGAYQKYKILKKVEQAMEDAEKNVI